MNVKVLKDIAIIILCLLGSLWFWSGLQLNNVKFYDKKYSNLQLANKYDLAFIDKENLIIHKIIGLNYILFDLKEGSFFKTQLVEDKDRSDYFKFQIVMRNINGMEQRKKEGYTVK